MKNFKNPIVKLRQRYIVYSVYVLGIHIIVYRCIDHSRHDFENCLLRPAQAAFRGKIMKEKIFKIVLLLHTYDSVLIFNSNKSIPYFVLGYFMFTNSSSLP